MYLVLFLTLSLSFSFAQDVLKGKAFSSCEELSKKTEFEYVVEYMDGDEEFEAKVFYEKGKKPCKGRAIFAIGRIWKYELNQNELITTLEQSSVILLASELISSFNKEKVCGISNWKTDKIVPCEGKVALEREEIPGYRTIHQFKLQGRKMIVTESDGETFELNLKK